MMVSTTSFIIIPTVWAEKKKELQNTLLDRKDTTMNIRLETAEIFCDSQTL